MVGLVRCLLFLKLVFQLVCCNFIHSNKTAGKYDISGLECAPEDSIAVRFCVLLPYAVWVFNEQTKLVMYFGHQKLGFWKVPTGNFSAEYVDNCF